MIDFDNLHMDPVNSTNYNTQAKELLDAQTHIWNDIFSFHNATSLKCAVELGIPDAIQKHGKPITLTELTNALAINPIKAPYLHRLMRFLVHSNYFKKKTDNGGEELFDLNINSQLLLKDHPLTQAPLVLGEVDPFLTSAPHHLSSWFKTDADSPFHIAHGRSIWEHADCVSKFNEYFNQAMASDSRLIASILVNDAEFKNLFEGIESLVDVGGGDGTMAKAIAKAYPKLKCLVLDLPHVVEGLQPGQDNLAYVGGDMFEAIPSSQVVLLKWILHAWRDEDCIQILQRCKKTVPNKDQGGKVIIMDIVAKHIDDATKYSSAELLFDMQMMCATSYGKQRTEEEWRTLFITAGFSDYKISCVLGFRSIIEVYYS